MMSSLACPGMPTPLFQLTTTLMPKLSTILFCKPDTYRCRVRPLKQSVSRNFGRLYEKSDGGQAISAFFSFHTQSLDSRYTRHQAEPNSAWRHYKLNHQRVLEITYHLDFHPKENMITNSKPSLKVSPPIHRSLNFLRKRYSEQKNPPPIYSKQKTLNWIRCHMTPGFFRPTKREAARHHWLSRSKSHHEDKWCSHFL